MYRGKPFLENTYSSYLYRKVSSSLALDLGKHSRLFRYYVLIKNFFSISSSKINIQKRNSKRLFIDGWRSIREHFITERRNLKEY